MEGTLPSMGSFPFEDLSLLFQLRMQLRVIDLLDRGMLIDRQAGCRGRRLARHHQYWFHADAAEGRVTR